MTPLRLAAVSGYRFDVPLEPGTKDGTEYFADMMAAYDMPVDALAARRAHTTFDQMIGHLLPQVGAWGDRFDLAVLAHSTPDSRPIWAMSHLVDRVAEPGLAFAVSDQGVATAFTALRMAVHADATHGARRAQLWVADQTLIGHTGPLPDRLRPQHDAAVVLVLDTRGPSGRIEAHQMTGVNPEEVPDRMAARIDSEDPTSGGRPSCLVLGRGLEGIWDPGSTAGTVHWAPPGLPCTGVWMVVAERLPQWRATGERVLIADYDKDLRYLSVGGLDVPAATGMEET